MLPHRFGLSLRRFPQSTLWRVHGIRTVRRTLAEVAALGSVGADGTLRVGDDTASLVYFRAG